MASNFSDQIPLCFVADVRQRGKHACLLSVQGKERTGARNTLTDAARTIHDCSPRSWFLNSSEQDSDALMKENGLYDLATNL